MRRLAIVVLGSAFFLNAAELPARFPLSPAEPVIAADARPTKFISSVGRRSAILGHEDGTFEAWINPVKIVRDFRFSVYFDGSLEPTPIADLAERVHVSPGRVTITHSHAAFTIRQTWVAALDTPALIVLLDIDTDRPLRMRASFLPEMKPMWPASFGGQSSSFVASEKLFVLGEGLRKHAAVLGSPAFTRSSEQIGHQLPDRTVLVEMDVTPSIAKDHILPIVLVESNKGSQEARKLYHETLVKIPEIIRESDEYYRDFGARTFRIETPVPELNHAFEWAKYALEKGWACNDGVGCGLVAGYGLAAASERPGFGWYFGGDAFMNSWGILDYGDFARARGVLTFLRDRQRADGKMMHELTQSAALLDWSQYPYGYYHADTTPLYLISMARYVERSGDTAFLKQSRESVEKAYKFCVSMLENDGLMSNRKAGAGAVETGALSGKVSKDVYLQGVWLAALDAYVRLTGSDDAKKRLATARTSMNKWFLTEKPWLPFGELTDGSRYEAQSSWQAFALAWGGLDPDKTLRAASALSRSELTASWGTRLFATDSPYYDPLSYNDGSVWPFVTGFVIMAEYRNHQARSGLRHLFGVGSMTGVSGRGYLTEYMSGQRAQALPRSVPHQLFSSSAVVYPLVSGMLGLQGDAHRKTLTLAPHTPLAWKRLKFENYRVGASLVSGEITNDDEGMHVRVEVKGEPLDVTISPAFPLGTKLNGLRGNDLKPGEQETGVDLHIPVVVEKASVAEVTYLITPGTEAPSELKAPEVGSK